MQILEKYQLHIHQFFETKCLAANIGLAAISVLLVDGNECFFNYFTHRLKEAADHPQLRRARIVVCHF